MSPPAREKVVVVCNTSTPGGIGVGMERIAARSTDADRVDDFTAFYNVERDGAVRLAWLLTHDAAAAEDVVQDAFTRVYSRFVTLDRPAAYLRTTVVHCVYERSRASGREQRRLDLVRSGAATSVDGPTGGLADAVAKLPLPQRTAVVLRYWADLSDTEIGAAMSLRPGSVRSLLSRATARLRKDITT